MKKIHGLTIENALNGLVWHDYPQDRKISQHKSGFKIILPKNYEEPMSLFCPVCDCGITSQEDIGSMKERQACDHCVTRYYYPNAEKWKNGWRPEVLECDHKSTINLGG